MPRMEIGHVIRTLRRAKKLNQTDLAALLGESYNQANISRIENGAQDLDTKQLFAVAKALDVRASDIIALAETPIEDTRWGRYLALYARLTPKQIDAILALGDDDN